MDEHFFTVMQQEIGLSLIILLLLGLKIAETVKSNAMAINLVNLLVIGNFLLGLFLPHRGTQFGASFVSSDLIFWEKSLLSLGFVVVSLMNSAYLQKHAHCLEFYILLLTTLLGMDLMISSNNFLLFYLGLEMSTIPLAALVNFDLTKIKSAEGGMKLILSSAFSSGIFLFGVSYLYGTTGSLTFSTLQSIGLSGPLELFSLLLVFSGFAFKLSAVPFHFWTADVYEGAPIAITSYLSVVSKSSIVIVFIAALIPLFAKFQEQFHILLFGLIILTITVGNLFALRQDNLKRFFAFSSIAQMGYVMLGLISGSVSSNTSAFYFLLIYLFSNLTVFGVLSILSDQAGIEHISALKGFYKNNPVLSWIFAIGLFSLAGVPPTAGFFGKMLLVTAGAGIGNYWVVGIAAANMVVALYYYLRIVKTIFMDKSTTETAGTLTQPVSSWIAFGICLTGILLCGYLPTIYANIEYLFSNR